MKMGKSAIKEEFDFLELAFVELRKIDEGDLISFRRVTKRFGVIFHLSRQQTFQILRLMENGGLLRIHPYNGVRLLK